ncbi:phospholipase A and acyltransferase 3-like [Carcharodon carcharias]|uniref:phospholipase A and acyltransferase 3-like n=1 Tax=Carcharodon carcharias TaxID=13397 RepID=UPI001B7EB37C|nr:phospholipase A and acyltransferase 3-like [Carcharodon carcharias]
MHKSSRQLKCGDLIEIFRVGYQHWAIYVGGGYVIHLTGDGGSSSMAIGLSSSTECAVVKKQLLSEVAGNYKYRVNNSSDKKRVPLPVDQIIKNAGAKIGKRMKYKITAANCEHFVNELRYGKKISYQAAAAARGVAAGVGTALLGAALVPSAPFAVLLAAGVTAGFAVNALKNLL